MRRRLIAGGRQCLTGGGDRQQAPAQARARATAAAAVRLQRRIPAATFFVAAPRPQLLAVRSCCGQRHAGGTYAAPHWSPRHFYRTAAAAEDGGDEVDVGPSSLVGAMGGPSDGGRSGERIAKRLARLGLGSRKQAEQWVVEGRVAVDGTVISSPATLVTRNSKITMDSKPVPDAAPPELLLYNKPPRLIVSRLDRRRTIFDELEMMGLPTTLKVISHTHHTHFGASFRSTISHRFGFRRLLSDARSLVARAVQSGGGPAGLHDLRPAVRKTPRSLISSCGSVHHLDFWRLVGIPRSFLQAADERRRAGPRAGDEQPAAAVPSQGTRHAGKVG